VRFWRWTTSYSPDAETAFHFWSNLGYSLRGQVRLFFGGRFNLLRGLMNPGVVLLLIVFAVAVVLLIAAVLWNLLSLKRRLRRARLMPQQKTVVLLALVWAFSYLGFLFFWLPQNTFYRLFYLPSLVLLLGLALAALISVGERRTYVVALFVAAVSLANFLFLIYPFSHVEKYAPLAFAAQMNHEWPPGTVVYYAATNSDASLVRYFNPQTEWRVLPEQLPSGATAWLETTAIDRLSATPQGAQWLREHTRPGSLRELSTSAHRIRFVQLNP
jgi:peptidoglycan/LPS O-acetylase OafA/YrhL